MRLQMEVRRQSLWTGWSKLNHIIPVWVFFSVYNVFYASLGKHFEFDVDVAFCYECVCTGIWKYLNMRDSRNYFSINDIELYRMHVHGS